MKLRLIAFTILAFTGYGLSEDHAVPHAGHGDDSHIANQTSALLPTDTVLIPTESNRDLYRPTRCDKNGNIYFRAYESEDRKIPVTRVDAKGATLKYTIDSDADFAKGASYDFSVLPNGNLYRPVQVGQDVYLVAYDHNANILWKTKLEKQFWISHLTALSDESFLVSGVEIHGLVDGVRPPPKLFVALFDHQGKIVRRLDLEKDTASAEQTSQSKGAATKEPIVLPAIEGDAQAGPDGNIYWMLRSESPVVDVLNQSGKVIRSFSVTPPGRHMVPISMSLGDGKLAIFFRGSFRGMPTSMTGMPGMERMKGIVSVVNAAGGTVIANYIVGPEFSEAMACYQGNTFVFVVPEKNNLAIQFAMAK